jgi:uroporphyrinogen-III synthase
MTGQDRDEERHDEREGSALPLAGAVIALPESRELDRLATILESDGARALRCPLVAIRDAPDPSPVDAWLRELVKIGFDDVIFLTGEGCKRLLARAQHIGCYEDALAALRRARKITRGPKPARALHEAGLATDLAAQPPTSQGVMETLARDDLRGHRVGLQLYGTEPNEPLVRFLAGAGAEVRTVAPYVYASAADDAQVVALIGALDGGGVDVIAFTSASQVDRLWNVAQENQLEPKLRSGLRRTKVAAIGPVAVEALEDRGIGVDIVPEQPFVMKRLTAAIVAALGKQTEPR